MKLEIPKNTAKKDAFRLIEKFLKEKNLPVAATDESRPWGGFFKIDESATQQFINEFFSDIPVSKVKTTSKLSPKILLVEKGKRLSWQYHHRRSEIWKVIAGRAFVVISDTDIQNEPQQKNINDVIVLNQGQRHRLIGEKEWGVIAEIWQHTDETNPSDEDDIVRVQDDFGR